MNAVLLGNAKCSLWHGMALSIPHKSAIAVAAHISIDSNFKYSLFKYCEWCSVASFNASTRDRNPFEHV